MKELLTVSELAEVLRTPVSWVYSRTREKGPRAIPRVRVGKYIRFRLDDVLDWLNEQSEAY